MNNTTVITGDTSTISSVMTTRGQQLFDNMTTNSTNNPLNATMRNYVISTDGKDFFEHLDLRDETTFVALIVMGVFVPAIFITMFLLIYFKRKKQVQERKSVMLLRNSQDIASDDYSCIIR